MRSRMLWVLALAITCSGANATTEQDVLVLLANPLSNLNRFSADVDSDHDLGSEGDIDRLTVTPDATFSVDWPKAWRMVSRTRVPYIETDDHNGWGDIEETLLFTPSKHGEVAWAIGTAVRLNTANDAALGLDAWGVGPAFALVQRDGSDVSGLVASLLWSTSRDGPDIYRVEGFTTWNRHGVGVSLDLEAEYNSQTQETRCPISLGISRVARLGTAFVDVGARVRYFVDVPIDKGPWGLGITITLVRGFAAR